MFHWVFSVVVVVVCERADATIAAATTESTSI